MSFIENKIEWVSSFSVVLITTFSVFKSCVNWFFPTLKPIISVLPYFIILLLLVYQFRHYKIKTPNISFVLFFLFYSLYVLLDITVFKVYSLEFMVAVPQSISNYITNTIIIICYFLCTKTIVNRFCVKKYILLSIMFGIIPTLWYVNYVGQSFLYTFGQDRENDLFIHPLVLAFSNLPTLIMVIISYNKLFKKGVYNWVLVSSVVISVLYIFLVTAKRGPLLWSVVVIIICTYLKNRKSLKYLIKLSLVLFLLYINLDTFLDLISTSFSYSAERISNAIYAGDTSGRLDSRGNVGAYTLAINQIQSSPIWGSYFRIVHVTGYFNGHYPHNMFLEILMTMGLFGFVPFIILMGKAFLNLYKYVKARTQKQLIFIALFLSVFCELQTTGTIVLNTSFWFFFYIMYTNDFSVVAQFINMYEKKKQDKSTII